MRPLTYLGIAQYLCLSPTDEDFGFSKYREEDRQPFIQRGQGTDKAVLLAEPDEQPTGFKNRYLDFEQPANLTTYFAILLCSSTTVLRGCADFADGTLRAKSVKMVPAWALLLAQSPLPQHHHRSASHLCTHLHRQCSRPYS